MPEKRPRADSSSPRKHLPDEPAGRLILAPRSIRCMAQASSKKRALDVLSQMLAEAVEGGSADPREPFDILAETPHSVEHA